MCNNIRNLFKICFPSLSLVIKFWDGRPPPLICTIFKIKIIMLHSNEITRQTKTIPFLDFSCYSSQAS